MFRRVLAILACLALAGVMALPAGPGEAQILQRLFGGPGNGPPPPPEPMVHRPGGILDMLFGPRGVLPPSQPLMRIPNGTFDQRFGDNPPPPPPQTPTVTVAAKDPNAKKILVVGDFVAGGLAWGLDQTFAEEPGLAVVDRSNNSSGLVRDDFYDWNSELLKILNEVKPDVVVVALGANDRQEMRVGKERIAPHTPAWEEAYTHRIAALADTLKVYGRPFFWVSAPPLRLAAAMRDMLYLNDFYEPAVTAAGGHFVDIWNGFTSQEGNYISSGPDVDGQLRALRSGDGVNFTRAGRLKLAFYVEREIRRQTGLGAGAVDLLASTTQENHIEIGPDGTKRLVGPVISLSDPLPGGGDILAGGPQKAPVREQTPRYLMIVKGAAPPVVPGRADDFTWPPPETSAAAEPAATLPASTAAN